MAGSNIPDIASDPEKGILKVTSSYHPFCVRDIKLFSFPCYDFGCLACSFKRSLDWTWTMRPAFTFSRILSMRV